MSGIPKDPKNWYVVVFDLHAKDESVREHSMDVLANSMDQAENLAKSCTVEGMKWKGTFLQGTREEYERMLERRPFG